MVYKTKAKVKQTVRYIATKKVNKRGINKVLLSKDILNSGHVFIKECCSILFVFIKQLVLSI